MFVYNLHHFFHPAFFKLQKTAIIHFKKSPKNQFLSKFFSTKSQFFPIKKNLKLAKKPLWTFFKNDSKKTFLSTFSRVCYAKKNCIMLLFMTSQVPSTSNYVISFSKREFSIFQCQKPTMTFEARRLFKKSHDFEILHDDVKASK